MPFQLKNILKSLLNWLWVQWNQPLVHLFYQPNTMSAAKPAKRQPPHSCSVPHEGFWTILAPITGHILFDLQPVREVTIYSWMLGSGVKGFALFKSCVFVWGGSRAYTSKCITKCVLNIFISMQMLEISPWPELKKLPYCILFFMINNTQLWLLSRNLQEETCREAEICQVWQAVLKFFCFLSHQMSQLALREQRVREFSTHLSLFFSLSSYLTMASFSFP